MKNLAFAAFAAAALSLATPALSSTLRLDGYTSAIASVSFGASPVTPAYNPAGATGFNITDTSGSMGSFVAWCVDLGHKMMSKGASQNYHVTGTPWSNAYGLSATAIQRITALFNAVYATLDVTDKAQASAFQVAIWEAAYERSTTSLSLTTGQFKASTASSALAQSYLAKAAAYTGKNRYKLTFLEVSGLGPTRGVNTGQNLVTASAVPLPAGALLLIGALGGLFVLRRRNPAA